VARLISPSRLRGQGMGGRLAMGRIRELAGPEGRTTSEREAPYAQRNAKWWELGGDGIEEAHRKGVFLLNNRKGELSPAQPLRRKLGKVP